MSDLTRRSFLRTAAGLFVAAAGVAYVPKVIYSFPSPEPLLGFVDTGTYITTYPKDFGRVLSEVYPRMLEDMLDSPVASVFTQSEDGSFSLHTRWSVQF